MMHRLIHSDAVWALAIVAGSLVFMFTAAGIVAAVVVAVVRAL